MIGFTAVSTVRGAVIEKIIPEVIRWDMAYKGKNRKSDTKATIAESFFFFPHRPFISKNRNIPEMNYVFTHHLLH